MYAKDRQFHSFRFFLIPPFSTDFQKLIHADELSGLLSMHTPHIIRRDWDLIGRKSRGMRS